MTSYSLKTFNSTLALSHWFRATITNTMRRFRSCFYLSCNFSLFKSQIKVGSNILADLSTVEPSALISNNFGSIEIMNCYAPSLKVLISVMVTSSFCFSLVMVSSTEKPILILLTLKKISSFPRSISINCLPFLHFSMIYFQVLCPIT